MHSMVDQMADCSAQKMYSKKVGSRAVTRVRWRAVKRLHSKVAH